MGHIPSENSPVQSIETLFYLLHLHSDAGPLGTQASMHRAPRQSPIQVLTQTPIC